MRTTSAVARITRSRNSALPDKFVSHSNTIASTTNNKHTNFPTSSQKRIVVYDKVLHNLENIAAYVCSKHSCPDLSFTDDATFKFTKCEGSPTNVPTKNKTLQHAPFAHQKPIINPIKPSMAPPVITSQCNQQLPTHNFIPINPTNLTFPPTLAQNAQIPY